jgi:type I restriction enzyme, S subunit
VSELGQWMATLPPAWETKPLKVVASYTVSNVDKIASEGELPVRLCNYTDVYNNEFITPALDLMRSTATPQEIARFRLHAGDVVITKDSEAWNDIAVPALVTESADDLVCGYHLAVIRPVQDRMLGRYLFRCLQSRAIRLQLELAATGITRFGLPKDEIGKLPLPVPCTRIQGRIADHLDTETAQIDALVAEKEQMLALLQEKRAALVSRAVTRGLDPDARLKHSGLDWLGDIPESWETQRLKFILRGIDQGWSPQSHSFPAREGRWGVLKTGCVNGGVFREGENKELPDNIEPPDNIAVSVGDVLMSRASGSPDLIGSVARVERQPATRLILSDKIFRLLPNAHVIRPDYLVVVMGSTVVRHQIKEVISGAEGLANNVARSDIGAFMIPLPSLVEQDEILALLTRQRAHTILLEEVLRRSIALLRERRGALITAAVTGQLAPEMVST